MDDHSLAWNIHEITTVPLEQIGLFLLGVYLFISIKRYMKKAASYEPAFACALFST